jgi:hypothetical protein
MQSRTRQAKDRFDDAVIKVSRKVGSVAHRQVMKAHQRRIDRTKRAIRNLEIGRPIAYRLTDKATADLTATGTGSIFN